MKSWCRVAVQGEPPEATCGTRLHYRPPPAMGKALQTPLGGVGRCGTDPPCFPPTASAMLGALRLSPCGRRRDVHFHPPANPRWAFLAPAETVHRPKRAKGKTAEGQSRPKEAPQARHTGEGQDDQ